MTPAEILMTSIHEKLIRSSVVNPSSWAEKYRIMGGSVSPGPFSFKMYPWSKGIHDCTSERMYAKKAAQMGFTEVALNKTFFTVDIKGNSVLYVLPSAKPDASDFSSSRFDPALELSEYLKKLFSDVANVGHKRAGNANLFIRGSKSRSQLKSLPVSLIIFDELDEMNQQNISLAYERLSGQIEKQIFGLSTPTIEDYGIDAYYKTTSMEHYFFKCPHCSKLTEFAFPECIVITGESITDPNLRNSYYICKECKHKLNHEQKIEYLSEGRWVPQVSERLNRGFHVSQMYSMTIRPDEFAEQYLRGLSNPYDEQEFYNSKLGLAHAVKGAKVTDQDIKQCTENYKMFKLGDNNKFYTMGIDVGTYLHFEIDEWYLDNISYDPNDINLYCCSRVVLADKVKEFEELDEIIQDFNFPYFVIDANPERRKALELVRRFQGIGRICFYARGVNGKEITVDDESVKVDRTTWLDVSLKRFQRQTISLPFDIPFEYKEHMKALVRVYNRNDVDNVIGKYEKPLNLPDHYAHARNYSEIALQCASTTSQNKSILGTY